MLLSGAVAVFTSFAQLGRLKEGPCEGAPSSGSQVGAQRFDHRRSRGLSNGLRALIRDLIFFINKFNILD